MGRENTEFWWVDRMERDHLEDRGVDGRIILRRIFWNLDVGKGWIDLARDKDSWRALVNAGMNLRVP